jgi:tetratricopeptide (TPR) repeat protein
MAASLVEEGYAAERHGDTELAQARYQAAIGKDDSFARAHAGLARVLLTLRDEAGSTQEAARAAELARAPREKAEAATVQGNIALAAGRSAEARSFMEAATAFDPTYAPAWSGLGAVLAADAPAADDPALAFEEAASAFRKAADLDPSSVSALVRLAETLRSLGRAEEVPAVLARARAAIDADTAFTPAQRSVLVLQLQGLSAE